METRIQNAETITDARYILEPLAIKRLAAILDSIGHVTSRDQAREALQCILVEVSADSWTFTATDSYMLATATTPNALHTEHAPNINNSHGSFTINNKAAKEWTKMLKPKSLKYAKIQVTETDVTLETPEQTHTHRKTSQIFPNYRQLLSTPDAYTDEEKAQAVSLNPAYLAQLATSADKLNPKNEPTTITITATHPTKPTQLAAIVQNVAAWHGIIMPVRVTR